MTDYGSSASAGGNEWFSDPNVYADPAMGGAGAFAQQQYPAAPQPAMRTFVPQQRAAAGQQQVVTSFGFDAPPPPQQTGMMTGGGGLGGHSSRFGASTYDG